MTDISVHLLLKRCVLCWPVPNIAMSPLTLLSQIAGRATPASSIRYVGSFRSFRLGIQLRCQGVQMYIGKNKGFVFLGLLGVVIAASVFLVFGYVVALSVFAGISGGSITAWLCSGLRRYPSEYIDIRDTD